MTKTEERINELDKICTRVTAALQHQEVAISRLNDGLAKAPDELAALRERIARIESRLEEALKRAETWDQRLWGYVAVLLGALLSLASGLIVALLKH